MDAQRPRGQCRVLSLHPPSGNSKCCTFPRCFFNLVLRLRSNGDAAASTDRCLPSVPNPVRLKRTDEDVP